MDLRDMRPMPANVEVELALLGILLLAPVKYDQVAGLLRPSDFYAEETRTIFSGIERMMERRLDLDAITLADYLKAQLQLEQAGGAAYIAQLPAAASVVRDVTGYAKIIADHALERRMLAAADQVREVVHAPGDPLEKLSAAQQAILDVAPNARGNGPRALSEALVDVIRGVGSRTKHGRASGLPTGFADLDQHTGGLRAGQLVIIAGRPAMGKSALAFQIAEHVALREQRSALVFSLEMTTEELVERMLSGVAGVEHERIRDGLLNDEDGPKIERATAVLDSGNLVIDDTPAISVAEIGARARTVKRRQGLALLVVDYLQLMPGKGNNRNEEMGSITRGLKALAKELQVPVVLLSQLSRKCEERNDKRPLLSDLRESGEIEQDADMVLMLYRDCYYYPDTEWGNATEVIFRKFRNGTIGTRRLTFIPHLVRFGNYLGGGAPSAPKTPPATWKRKKIDIPY